MRSLRRVRRRSLSVAGSLLIVAGLLPTAATPVLGASTELFFSEYIEGSSNNKALEIYNGTGAPVNLGASSYNVQMFFNGNPVATLTINLVGSVPDGGFFVLAQSSANATILARADQTNGSGWFNGDDAVVLRRGTTIVDSIGQAGFDPGTEWGTGLTSTMDNTLHRKAGIEAGDLIHNDLFDPAVEWDGFATDTAYGLGARTGDATPVVRSTDPANGGTEAARNASITVRFSEPVAVAGSWFSISCAASGPHTAAVTTDASGIAYVLNPDVDFAASELCTVTVAAANVTDADAIDPPNNPAGDHTFSFTTADIVLCGDPATAIHAVQGAGASSPLAGSQVWIEGVVVGDYQGPNQLSGFFVQEEDADTDTSAATSEGIFVFNTSFGVALGDLVRVRGTATEFSGMTELASVSSVLECSTGNSVTPAEVVLPVAAVDNFETVEGMSVEIDQNLTVTEVFTLGRFGEVALSSAGRLDTPTNVVEPGDAANALQSLNDRSRILLDDANNQQNVDPTFYPQGGLSALNDLRVGDRLAGVSGVLEFRFNVYRIQPVDRSLILFTTGNPRPAAPEAVGGNLEVAAFNVLNYFNGNGTGLDGAAGGYPTARGATTLSEFNRQRAKIISAIVALDADVVGLMELENDEETVEVAAIEDLVAGLNDATAPGRYDFIRTGIVGTDAIRVGIVYKPARVNPVGAHRIINSAVDPRFIDTLNRPSIAQTFELGSNGSRLTVLVNHLKSKGSGCDAVGDPDGFDGQGNCNGTRTNAARAIVDWLATDPTGSGDPDFIVIGDLNAYAKEDPIDVFRAAGYVDTIGEFLGDEAYSFVFQGQSGYLDHALATPSLAGQMTGVAEWHVNADEPVAFDYNDFNQPSLYAPDQFRSSDHDPVTAGFDLGRCVFADDPATKTRTLLGDCLTDETILVPDGWTLDGDGWTITAVDPEGDHFRGAVVANDGDVAHVTNLTVTARDLADVCDAGVDRLRGILFDGASGSITNNRVIDLNQGFSGCQEGNAIEVRNEPFDTTGTDLNVTISGNEITDYQKTGILANGSVFATISGNEVAGWGPTGVIAQNGVQIGFGGSGVIQSNSVSGNFYTGPDVACGLLFFQADGVKKPDNTLFANEQDVCNFGRGGGKTKPGK